MDTHAHTLSLIRLDRIKWFCVYFYEKLHEHKWGFISLHRNEIIWDFSAAKCCCLLCCCCYTLPFISGAMCVCACVCVAVVDVVVVMCLNQLSTLSRCTATKHLESTMDFSRAFTECGISAFNSSWIAVEAAMCIWIYSVLFCFISSWCLRICSCCC